MRWDIFCRVVDNYGDIGVCWRLARQLQQEHGLAVRLWVDDLASFARLCPAVQRTLAEQVVEGVTIAQWSGSAQANPATSETSAQVVIAAFGCDLPDVYLATMAAAETVPVWINLEYLSAESWVEGCHGLPSPHPRLPLQQYFFYPGFTARTGGLLRERNLLQEQEKFTEIEQQKFWQQFGLPIKRLGELRVSMFYYPQAPLAALLRCWAASPQPVTCMLAGDMPLPAGLSNLSGNLRVLRIPFLSQPDYDRLLWACDLNFVRGEDSFVRAQWAQKPLVWQIYPQQEAAHQVKLEAFLQRYLDGVPPAAAQAQQAFWQAWNQAEALNQLDQKDEAGFARLWDDFMAAQHGLQVRAHSWVAELARQHDLATQLVDFCQLRLK